MTERITTQVRVVKLANGRSRVEEDHIFVESERKFIKVNHKDILFIEGLKDYVVIQTENKKIITKMYLKTINIFI